MPVLEMFRGDIKTLPVYVKAVYDVDATIHFALKKQENILPTDTDDDLAPLKKDVGSEVAEVIDATTVLYRIPITEADINAVPPELYRAEITYLNGLGMPTTFDQFHFLVKPDINQRA